VFNSLRNFKGIIELSFYKEKNKDIDFIVSLGGKRYLPVEVKYRDTIDDIASIKHFVEKYHQRFGIVVTKTFVENKEENRLLFIPLSVFLLFF